MDSNYVPTSAIKYKICVTIANTPTVIDEIKYVSPDIDPDEPLTYIKKSILPYPKNPNTVTVTNPIITVTADVVSAKDYKVNIYVTIMIIVHNKDMNTSFGDTKTDYLSGEIQKALYNIKDGTWCSDVELVTDKEGTVGDDRMCRIVVVKMQDVNMGSFLQ